MIDRAESAPMPGDESVRVVPIPRHIPPVHERNKFERIKIPLDDLECQERRGEDLANHLRAKHGLTDSEIDEVAYRLSYRRRSQYGEV